MTKEFNSYFSSMRSALGPSQAFAAILVPPVVQQTLQGCFPEARVWSVQVVTPAAAEGAQAPGNNTNSRGRWSSSPNVKASSEASDYLVQEAEGASGIGSLGLHTSVTV